MAKKQAGFSIADAVLAAAVTRISIDITNDPDQVAMECAILREVLQEVTRSNPYVDPLAECAGRLVILEHGSDIAGKGAREFAKAKHAARIELERFSRWRLGELQAAWLASKQGCAA